MSGFASNGTPAQAYDPKRLHFEPGVFDPDRMWVPVIAADGTYQALFRNGDLMVLPEGTSDNAEAEGYITRNQRHSS